MMSISLAYARLICHEYTRDGFQFWKPLNLNFIAGVEVI